LDVMSTHGDVLIVLGRGSQCGGCRKQADQHQP
jgi:bacterioferritin-associated ferredoxin